MTISPPTHWNSKQARRGFGKAFASPAADQRELARQGADKEPELELSPELSRSSVCKLQKPQQQFSFRQIFCFLVSGKIVSKNSKGINCDLILAALAFAVPFTEKTDIPLTSFPSFHQGKRRRQRDGRVPSHQVKTHRQSNTVSYQWVPNH